MAALSGITVLSGSLRLLLTYNTHHRVTPSALGSFDTLFTGIACLGFERLYQLLVRNKSNAISGTQTEIELAHVGFIFAWFFFIFMVQKMNLPHRSVSSWALVAIVFAAVCVVANGFVMRKKLFRLSTESLPGDFGKALRRWKGAHFISFSNATVIAILGAALKFLGVVSARDTFRLELGLSFVVETPPNGREQCSTCLIPRVPRHNLSCPAKFAINHCNLVYSDLACFRMGMSESASFQSVRKSFYAASARTRAASVSTPCADLARSAFARARPRCASAPVQQFQTMPL